MATQTDFLGLTLFGQSAIDLDQRFLTYRLLLNGEESSNMHLIDDWAKSADGRISNMESSIATMEETVSSLENTVGSSISSFVSVINGVAAVNGEITLTAESIGAKPADWTVTLADLGGVPDTRTVNGKTLSENIVLNAEDVGAADSQHTHTLEELGAPPAEHTHEKLAYIDQDVRTTSSPTFKDLTVENITAVGTITADKVIGAVYV